MTSRDQRKALIKKIEDTRKSKVITYVTSDRANLSVPIAADVISIINEHILSLTPEERKKIDLFIYSRGGQADVPWALVSMFREYVEDGSFNVLIPYRAHSAATVISLGADEIVMTKKSELGPIDATMGTGPYNPQENGTNQRLPIAVEDVTGYFSLMEKIGCERPDEKMKGFELITKHVHPLALGTVNRLLEETKLVAFRLLSTRKQAFREEKNHEIIKKLSSEVYSHNHAICRNEARKYIGLSQVINAEEAKISDEMWSLYLYYRELFDLENPFKPEEYLVSNNLLEHTWNDLNLACVESNGRLDLCKKSVKVKRVKQIPPQINLNLSNIQFPPVTVPNLPPGINQEGFNILVTQVVNQVVQGALNQASIIAVQQLLASLPDAGFQQLDLNSGWITEN
jgi:hypothetical protein